MCWRTQKKKEYVSSCKEKLVHSVFRIFSSLCLCVIVCVRERWWLRAQEAGEVVPFGGLPLTSTEGGKDTVSSHCCCWKPSSQQGSIMHVNDIISWLLH